MSGASCIFVLENEETQATQVVTLQLQNAQALLPLAPLVSQVGWLAGSTLRAYDFQLQKYLDVEGDSVPANPTDAGFVALLKCRCSRETSVGSLEADPQRPPSLRKERSRERSIFEVIELIKKWRDLHRSKDRGGKVNLQEAAAALGLRKKSLDDYYYQLRLAEQFGFNFRRHLEDRMGVLRAFLKGVKETCSVQGEKHPKRLRILDEYRELSNMHLQALIREESQLEGRPVRSEAAHSDAEQESEEGKERRLEGRFYSDFGCAFEEKDPLFTLPSDIPKPHSLSEEEFNRAARSFFSGAESPEKEEGSEGV